MAVTYLLRVRVYLALNGIGHLSEGIMTSDQRVSDSQDATETKQKTGKLSAFRDLFWEWAADYRARRLRRQALDSLSAMNDNLRRDIGVGRGNVCGFTRPGDQEI